MPEILEFEDYPKGLFEYHIEPFRQEYIPGSSVLCHEGSKGDEVFFSNSETYCLENLRKRIGGTKKTNSYLVAKKRRCGVKIRLVLPFFQETHQADFLPIGKA